MPRVSAEHLDARRRQIVEAAEACFARDGFHATTTDDIAREAELSPGLIYRHFASKDELIEAIADERHAVDRELLRAAAGAGDTVTAVRAVASGFLGSLRGRGERRRRRVAILAWAEALRNPRVRRSVRRGVDEPRRELARIVSAAQRRGELRAGLDPDALARAMIALFHGFVLQQAWDERVAVEPYLEAVDAIWEALLDAGRQSGRYGAPR